MTIKELKKLLDEYGDHVEVRIPASDHDEPPLEIGWIEYECGSESEYVILIPGDNSV